MMAKQAFLIFVLLAAPMLAACGSVPEAAQIPAAIEGPEGPPGPTGPQGDPFILSWGVYGGLPPENIITTGGPVGVVLFARVSEGVYKIVFDISTGEIGVVAAVATGLGTEIEGVNLTQLVGVSQDVNADNLTLNVVSVVSLADSIGLLDTDSLFSIIVFGDPL